MTIWKLTLYTLIVLIAFSAYPAYATETITEEHLNDELNAEEENNIVRDNFEIDLEVGTQSVWNNSIPITIYLTTAIDLDRVEIRASNPAALEFEYLGKQYFPAKAGENYVLRSRIFPKRQGNYRVSINAIAWQYDTNFSSSTLVDLQIDENLQVVPQTRQYYINLVLKYLFYIILIGGIGTGAFFAGKRGFKRFKIWLLPED